MKPITLYIPCFNAESTLRVCLESVFAQTLRPSEVLVIDDGSSDGTAETANEFGVRLVAHATNRGLGAGRNSAVAHASHEWIASLDADCVATSTWLETLALRLEADPALAGVGGRLVETNTATLADAWRTRNMPQHWGDLPIANPLFLFGNNNLFWKAALERAGGYNPKLRTNFEDVAMSEVLHELGYSLFYEPAAVVHHLRRDTVGSVLRGNWKWRFFGYRNDIDWRGLARGLRDERMVELMGFLRHDLRARALLGGLLSCVAVAYAVACDVRYLAQHHSENRIHDPELLRQARATSTSSGTAPG